MYALHNLTTSQLSNVATKNATILLNQIPKFTVMR
jgi:hypothetical protein